MTAPQRCEIIMWINEAVKAGAGKGAACRLLGLSLRTLQRWEKAPGRADQRKGSRRHVSHQLSLVEQKEIIATANTAEFRDLSPNKIVPLLADKGVYIASESSFYRVLKAAKQLAHRQRSKPPERYTKPAPLTATRPNAVWSWDITYLRTEVQGIYYYLYMHVDLYSRRIMGAKVHETESSDHAAALARSLIWDYAIAPGTLYLHSDNGSPMKGSTMLVTLQNLGVMPSFSRPGVSDDNPYSESLFKTLKYHPTYPEKPFKSLEAAQTWVDTFVQWYNTQHLHSSIQYVTPQMRYDGLDKAILKQRKNVYASAQAKRPDRWRRSVRTWEQEEGAVLLARKDFWKKSS